MSLIFSGEDHFDVFSTKLDALVPSRIKMMALTATATKTLRQQICHVLGMFDYVLVEKSPDKPNVYLECQEFQSIVETFLPCRHTCH